MLSLTCHSATDDYDMVSPFNRFHVNLEGRRRVASNRTIYTLLRMYRTDANSSAHRLTYYEYIVSVFEYFIIFPFFWFVYVCCDFFVTTSLFASHFLCAPLVQHKCMWKALYPLFLQTHIKGFFLSFFLPVAKIAVAVKNATEHIDISCARSLYSSTVPYTFLSRQASRAWKKSGNDI